MTRFEDQLTQSAKRLKKADAHLSAPSAPRIRPRTAYWGWVAAPVAAVAGVIFGLNLNKFVNTIDETATIVQVRDTIRVPQIIKDTVYLSKVVEREHIVWRDKKEETSAAPIATSAQQTATPIPQECTSVACDGIDYSLMVVR